MEILKKMWVGVFFWTQCRLRNWTRSVSAQIRFGSSFQSTLKTAAQRTLSAWRGRQQSADKADRTPSDPRNKEQTKTTIDRCTAHTAEAFQDHEQQPVVHLMTGRGEGSVLVWSRWGEYASSSHQRSLRIWLTRRAWNSRLMDVRRRRQRWYWAAERDNDCQNGRPAATVDQHGTVRNYVLDPYHKHCGQLGFHIPPVAYLECGKEVGQFCPWTPLETS